MICPLSEAAVAESMVGSFGLLGSHSKGALVALDKLAPVTCAKMVTWKGMQLNLRQAKRTRA